MFNTPSIRVAFPLVVLLGVVLPGVGAQETAMGRIHGRVINPAGVPQSRGMVSLATERGAALPYAFPVMNGTYFGNAPAGTYMVTFRGADSPHGKIVDFVRRVEIGAGQDVVQDIDMSRPGFIARMDPEQRRVTELLQKKNAAAMEENRVIAVINDDLKVVNRDILEADEARATAVNELGGSASTTEVEAKFLEIRSEKYHEIESLMTRDMKAEPGSAILSVQLARAHLGLKRYNEAMPEFKRALGLQMASGKQDNQLVGVANEGIGEIYARWGRVAEANAAFDAAVQADPSRAGVFLRNQAIVFYQEHNVAAQIAAADQGIKATPGEAVLYYIKGNGLCQSAGAGTVSKGGELPADCVEAYRTYLRMDPEGTFSAEVREILDEYAERAGLK